MKLLKPRLLGLVGIVFIALTLSNGCSTATNPIVSEWRNPAYVSAPFKRIMVGGPSGNASVRRSFEDEFVVQLRATGVDALASYRYIPEDQEIDDRAKTTFAKDKTHKIVMDTNEAEILGTFAYFLSIYFLCVF